MFNLRNYFRKLAEDPGTGDPGTGDPGTGAPAATSQPATQQAAPPATTSALAQGATAPTDAEKAAATAAAEQNAWLPEKYQVKKQDGSVDIEASAKKQADAYKALETRLGTGDVPPKTPDEYTFDVPEVLKDQWKPEEDEQYLDFKKEAHKLGFTQKQFEYAVNRHLETLGELGGGAASMDPMEFKTTMAKIWPDEKTYGRNMNAAYRAVTAYANPGSEEQLGSFVNIERKFGNDPDFVAFMANIGRETREDIPPIGSILTDENVDELQKSKAYWDPNDPKHAEVKAKVSAHYARKYAGNSNSR